MIDYQYLVDLINSLEIFGDRGAYYDSLDSEFDNRIFDDTVASFYIQSDESDSDKEFKFVDLKNGLFEISENLKIVATFPSEIIDVIKLHDKIISLLSTSSRVSITSSSIKTENIIRNEMDFDVKNTGIKSIKINFNYKITTSIPDPCCK